MNILDKEILRLAIPSIFANITVPLVGMADIAIAGHLSESAAVFIGGISIGTLLFDLLYWNFSFLRIGTGGMTAQAYGRGDMRAATETLLRSTIVSMSIAIVCILIQWIFVDFVFLFVKCSSEVRELAELYFHIRIWAAPATLTLMALKGWFIGMQDSVSPMFADFIVNGLNIALSIILAMGLPSVGFEGIGFFGIAAGTVAAQYSGLVFAALMVMLKYHHMFAGFSRSDLRQVFVGKEMKSFFHLNADLFIRSMGIMGIYAGITVISARYGDMMLAVSSILVQLMMLFSYFTDGFAYAGEAMTGKYIGMRSVEGVRNTVHDVFKWSMGVAVVFMVLYVFFSRSMLHVLTSDSDVVEAAMAFIPWLIPMPLFGCAAFTWDGIYVGATASKPIRNSTLWAVVGFFATWFIGWWFLKSSMAISPSLSVHILMAAFLVHLIVRMSYQTVLYKKSILGKITLNVVK